MVMVAFFEQKFEFNSIVAKMRLITCKVLRIIFSNGMRRLGEFPGKWGLDINDFRKRRLRIQVSQVPKSEAPGAPIVGGQTHFIDGAPRPRLFVVVEEAEDVVFLEAVAAF
jgi:hypothetical protein